MGTAMWFWLESADSEILGIVKVWWAWQDLLFGEDVSELTEEMAAVIGDNIEQCQHVLNENFEVVKSSFELYAAAGEDSRLCTMDNDEVR